MNKTKFDFYTWIYRLLIILLVIVTVGALSFAVYMLLIYSPAHECYFRGVPPFGFLECAR